MRTLMRRNRMYPEIPSLFNEFFTGDLLENRNFDNLGSDSTLPSVNIMDTENSFEIEVAAPGMTKKDFKVELNNNILTISSENESTKKDENENYTRKEFSYQSFLRSFRLPENKVDGNKINAKYKNGILFVSLPKKEEAKLKPVRMIEID
ncbi:MAG: Hsp20/alpha crystallin family protein [Bacteroidota bacterium]|nr:Hsp20/alpha crystallin family protein [Bacteroidota bacterium]